MHNLPVKRRLLLSGTPIQNNLQELWAVMDWTTCRTLLGSRTTFKELFIDPILKGQVRAYALPILEFLHSFKAVQSGCFCNRNREAGERRNRKASVRNHPSLLATTEERGRGADFTDGSKNRRSGLGKAVRTTARGI